MPARNPFLLAAAMEAETKMATQHQLIQPFELAGMGVNEILVNSAILLIERGNVEGLKLAQQMLGRSDEIEQRALIRLREALREQYTTGEAS